MAKSPEEALRRISATSGNVAIAIPDHTREIDVSRALRALETWLKDANVTAVVVGLGLHRPLSKEEIITLTGETSWRVINHNPDTCSPITTIRGVPIEVNPVLAEADTIVTVGKIELHQYAGFSGGYKGTIIGCGGRQTIAALHHRDIVCDESVRVGRLSGNLFREIIDEAGLALSPTIALQQVGSIGWCAGDPALMTAFACEELASWENVEETYSCAIIRTPPSKQINFYQASRGATYLALSENPPLTDGAHIIIDASCTEGIGSGDGEKAFAEVMQRSAPHFDSLLTGTPPSGGGTQRAIMIAKLLQKYRLTVANCLNPAPLRTIGIEATSQTPEALASPKALVVDNPFARLPQLKRSFR